MKWAKEDDELVYRGIDIFRYGISVILFDKMVTVSLNKYHMLVFSWCSCSEEYMKETWMHFRPFHIHKDLITKTGVRYNLE